MMPNPSVSIVLPCLNEAATVGLCIDRALQCLKVLQDRHGIGGEVVVADNGSTDGSVAISIARGARVVHVTERGYGAALQAGFKTASGEYLVMGDSDCSYDFLEAVGMVEALMKGADVCMGSRQGYLSNMHSVRALSREPLGEGGRMLHCVKEA